LAPEGAIGVLPPVVPLGELPPAPPAPPAPLPEPPDPPVDPEPEAWPGLKFSVALAARAMKADMVLLPDAGLEKG
jgi:hypothetical protein